MASTEEIFISSPQRQQLLQRYTLHHCITLILPHQVGYFANALIQQISTHHLDSMYVHHETGQTTMETEEI